MESSSVQGDFYGKFLHLLYIAATFSTSGPVLVTPKQSSTTYYWLIPLSKRIPFTFDRHISDLPQRPLKLISAPLGVLAPQVKKPWSIGMFTFRSRMSFI